jgi:hypothetical protein
MVRVKVYYMVGEFFKAACEKLGGNLPALVLCADILKGSFS